MTALPGVNVSVELSTDHWPAPARTRVEDVAERTLTVARPEWAGPSRATARIGDAMLVSWTTEDALYEVPVSLAAASDDRVPTWTLAVRAAPRRQQRRGAFRLDVRFSTRFGTGSEASELAQVHDLSEGGLRCTPPSGIHVRRGDRVWVELPLPDGAVQLGAEVVRVSEDGEVGLRFDELEEAEADRIRGYLFAEQLSRRAGSPGPGARR